MGAPHPKPAALHASCCCKSPLPLPARPCPPYPQEEEEAHAAIPTADVLEMEPLAPEAEAEAAAEAAEEHEPTHGRPLVQESELQLGQEDVQVWLPGLGLAGKLCSFREFHGGSPRGCRS